MTEQKRYLKGELLKQLQDLNQEKLGLRKDRERILDQYPTQIASLQLRADSLADQFKDCYARAAQAYTLGAKGLAKELSEEGHCLQNNCEELNRQANEMRRELRDVSEPLYTARIRRLDEELTLLGQNMRGARPTNLEGWDKTHAPDVLSLELFLDTFPQNIFRGITSIQYAEKLYWESEIRKVQVEEYGRTEWDSDNKATIKIATPEGKTPAEKLANIKRVIAHEIGHVVYEETLTDEGKAHWYALHNETQPEDSISMIALENDIEDFAECFSLMKNNAPQLAKVSQRKYSFLHDFYEKLMSQGQ